MNKIVLIKITEPIFRRKMWVVIGEQKKAIKRLGKEKELKDVFFGKSINSHGCVWITAGGRGVLWLENFKGRPQDYDHLCHEIFHLTYGMLDYVGVKLSDESEETFAYYSGFLTRTILEGIKKKK